MPGPSYPVKLTNEQNASVVAVLKAANEAAISAREYDDADNYAEARIAVFNGAFEAQDFEFVAAAFDLAVKRSGNGTEANRLAEVAATVAALLS
jgi:hypothetical protein